LWERAANIFCIRSSVLELVTTTEFQATEKYSSLDLTKATYSISRVCWERKMLLCELTLAISPLVNKENGYEENKVYNE
jgi:hypothetical protein